MEYSSTLFILYRSVFANEFLCENKVEEERDARDELCVAVNRIVAKEEAVDRMEFILLLRRALGWIVTLEPFSHTTLSQISEEP